MSQQETDHKCRGHLLDEISKEEIEEEIQICDETGQSNQARGWRILLICKIVKEGEAK